MNQTTFTELFQQHKERVVSSLLPMTKNRDVAEDITAAAFATALKKRDTFRGESAQATWLHAIAFNEARNWWRKNRSAQPKPIDLVDAEGWVEPDLLIQVLHQKECCARLRKALRRIPAKYRRVLVDHFIRGYRIREIATELAQLPQSFSKSIDTQYLGVKSFHYIWTPGAMAMR